MDALLVGIDLGTTHCKAGVYGLDGGRLRIASRATCYRTDSSGRPRLDPQELWATVREVLRDALIDAPGEVAAVGIASMAETGLLVDARSGEPRTPLIPWFDDSAAPTAAALLRADPAAIRQQFLKTGIRLNFKCGLVKLLWLQEREPGLLPGAVWLNTADYIAYRLSGAMATDYSLAGRTYAFDITRKQWDSAWLGDVGIAEAIFPQALPSGQPAGRLTQAAAAQLGMPAGIPVSVTGHDHVNAAFGVDCMVSIAGETHFSPQRVFDSIGTAEGMLGLLPAGEPAAAPLGSQELDSGLSYGCPVLPDRYYWMGGLSSSGGAVEWLRSLLGEPPLSYHEIEALLEPVQASGPTGILFFPYLAGSGSPHTDPSVRAAWVGLDSGHGRAELVKAVLEGTAFEMELIRRSAALTTGVDIDRVLAAGGGTRNRLWMQIKADIFGCPVSVPAVEEAASLGAALAAGWGAGVFPSLEALIQGLRRGEPQVYRPDPERAAAYRDLYTRGYEPMQGPLRALELKEGQNPV